MSKCKHGIDVNDTCFQCYNEWECNIYEYGPDLGMVAWIAIGSLFFCFTAGVVATILHCFGII